MNPVSRKSPLPPIRQEIPSVGSAIENTTVQPPLWRENIAIGALTEFVLRLSALYRRQAPQPSAVARRASSRIGLRLARHAVEENVVDHLVEIDRDLLVADRLRHSLTRRRVRCAT